ncbi:response regulator transcription factor [Pseudooceanicola spongiae]|uniref:Response regulator n=1 Tax=Pseudooceanicola spongiae TaxID=2613965 RepID=A0A7L9WNC9_9RHOB|nr:response regulator [Pseudooceanicola spongiae]QOL81915.1 response regulator [Pseudooceanicola spongiae]
MSHPLMVAIVDDDPGVRASVDNLLRSAGMEGTEFATAEELLACDNPGVFDCIVTDLHMPGMSGIELQEEMARRSWLKPVIVMTAYPTTASRQQALEHGARAFLTKPVDPDALLDAIEAASV